MAGGNFMGRVMSYLVNELLVDGLANRGYFASKEQGALEKYRIFENRAFQRFAVRTSKKIEDVSNIALKKRQELEEKLKELSQK